MKTLLVLSTLASFLITSVIGSMPQARADEFHLPAPGVMVHLSPEFNPPILKGIKVHSDNPFRFDFILDKGDSELGNDQLKDESSKLIKYFLASLTIPEKDLWVNLSPYEKDRIITQSFGLTEMGRDLLAEDYMLKQITASLIYPEDEVGKKFWKRIYEEAQKKFGTTDIPVNTFNKVWIVPENAVVYENAKAGTAYVVESKLKVMLEQDYLSLEKHEGIQSAQTQTKDTNQLGSQIVREIMIPQLTKEVNENKNFVKLRQVYNSLILATWYKKKIKDSILSQVYSDKNKVAGVNIADPQEKEKIYQRYLKAFKKGVYNYIKEEQDSVTQKMIPRKYFSGGAFLGLFENTDWGMAVNFQVTSNKAMINFSKISRRGFFTVAAALDAAAFVPKAFGQSIPKSTWKDYPRLAKRVDMAMGSTDAVRDLLEIIKKVDEKFGKGSIVIYGGLVRDFLLKREKSSGDIDILVRIDNPTPTEEDYEKADKILQELIDQLNVTRDGYKVIPDDLINGSVFLGNFVIDYLGLYHAETGRVIPKRGLEQFLGNIQESINTMWMRSDGSVVDPYRKGRQDLKDHVIRFVGADIEEFANHQTVLRALRFQHELGFSLEDKTKDIVDHFFIDGNRFKEGVKFRGWLQAVLWYKQYQEAKAKAEASKNYEEVYRLMDNYITTAHGAFEIYVIQGKPFSKFDSVEEMYLEKMEEARQKDNYVSVVESFESFMERNEDTRWPKGMDVKVDLTERKTYSPVNDPLIIGASIKEIFKYAQDPMKAKEDLERIGFGPFLEASGINLDEVLAQRARLDSLAKLSPQEQVDSLLSLKEKRLILALVQAMRGQLQQAVQTIRGKRPVIIDARTAKFYLDEMIHYVGLKGGLSQDRWGEILFFKNSKHLNNALKWVTSQLFKQYLGEPVNSVITGLDNSSEKIMVLEGLAATGSSETGDLAQFSSTNIKNGGIDLTPANMKLQTQNAGEGIKFHMDPVMLQQLQNAPGFVPVIINIQPLNNLSAFLGLNQTSQSNTG